MKVQLRDGSVRDLKTGQAMRLLQSGEAVSHAEPEEPKGKPEQVDDKQRAKGPKKDGRSDVPAR